MYSSLIFYRRRNSGNSLIFLPLIQLKTKLVVVSFDGMGEVEEISKLIMREIY